MDNITIGAYEIIRKLPAQGNDSQVLIRCIHCHHEKSTRKYDFLRSSGKCTNCGFFGIRKTAERKAKYHFKKASKNPSCAICGISSWQGEPMILDIDHIIPLNMGGKDDISNLCFLCPNCHRQKTTRERKEKKASKKTF